MDLEERVEYLEGIIKKMTYPDRFIFSRNIEMQDSENIKVGAKTGTMIGTSNLQKIGFFGVTPAVQVSIGGAANASGSYGNTEENMLNASYHALRTFGFIK